MSLFGGSIHLLTALELIMWWHCYPKSLSKCNSPLTLISVLHSVRVDQHWKWVAGKITDKYTWVVQHFLALIVVGGGDACPVPWTWRHLYSTVKHCFKVVYIYCNASRWCTWVSTRMSFMCNCLVFWLWELNFLLGRCLQLIFWTSMYSMPGCVTMETCYAWWTRQSILPRQTRSLGL